MTPKPTQLRRPDGAAPDASAATARPDPTATRHPELRGMSFAEGEAALAPAQAPVQLKAAPGAVVQLEKEKAAKSATDNFDTIAAGGVKEADAPDKVQLPKPVNDAMQESWKDSFPGGKSKEQGGVIVKGKDGAYDLKRSNKSKSGSLTPNYGDVKDDETLVGVGHTHPYDESEGGHKGVSFSGADLARLAVVQDKIALVEAGGTQFIAARTAEFDKLVEGKEKSERQKLMKEMNDCWNGVFKSTKGDIIVRAEAATKATCAKYHLVYYKGKSGDELSKVDTSK